MPASPNEVNLWGINIPIPLLTLLAALAGALITIVSVFIQNIFENRRNTQRLRHEAEQKNRDREMTLRRDVYLEAASQLAKAALYIANFGDLNLPLNEHQAIAENFGAAMSRVHMVAGMGILSKAIEASNEFARVNLELTLLRFSLLFDKQRIATLQKLVENDIAQQQNLVTRMGQLQAANPNHPEIPALAATFQELESRIQQDRQQYQELSSKQMAGHFNLSSIVFKRTLSFAEKLIEVTIALRKELDFDLKGRVMRKIIKILSTNLRPKPLNKWRSILPNWLKSLRKRISLLTKQSLKFGPSPR